LNCELKEMPLKCRVIITKRNRPIAAIINLKDLQALEQSDKRKGLFSITRKWKDFEELEKSISKAVNERHGEGAGRDVSF